MENKELLDYQQFYDEFVEQEYLPARIDYVWTDNNKEYMRETLFSYYTMYIRLKQKELLHPLLKLYSESMLAAHANFPSDETYM